MIARFQIFIEIAIALFAGLVSCTSNQQQSLSCEFSGQQLCLDLTTRGICNGDTLKYEAQPCQPGYNCWQGNCVPALCIPGEKGNCIGYEKIEVCNETGTNWDSEPCPDSHVCHEGACINRLCAPGAKRCAPQSTTRVQECDPWGRRWVDSEDCGGELTGKICRAGSCKYLCEVATEVKTNVGCSYWAADLDNYDDGADEAQFAVVVSNPHDVFAAYVTIRNVDGIVSDGQGQIDRRQVRAGALAVFNLPRRDVNGTVLDSLAYQVVSSIPVSAYQFNPLQNYDVFSNDASLLLTDTSLGKEYLVMSREQGFPTPGEVSPIVPRGFLTVLATLPGITNVEVTVTAPTISGEGIPALTPGETLTIPMTQFDVLNLETDAYGADLTGSFIKANKPIAVFGGSEAADTPTVYPRICCADHLEQQLFPINTWGKRYIATKACPRGDEADYWRILASENNTRVVTVPHQMTIPNLNRGDYFEFEAVEDFEIVADKPILVGQFLAGEWAPDTNPGGAMQPGDAATGDPAFIMAVPKEQFRTDYVFYTPSAYNCNYVNIFALTGTAVHMDGIQFEQPGGQVQCSCGLDRAHYLSDNLISPEAFSPIGQTGWTVARIRVKDGVHVLKSSKPVGIVAYGFDQYVSYGYPGGLNLIILR